MSDSPDDPSMRFIVVRIAHSSTQTVRPGVRLAVVALSLSNQTRLPRITDWVQVKAALGGTFFAWRSCDDFGVMVHVTRWSAFRAAAAGDPK